MKHCAVKLRRFLRGTFIVLAILLSFFFVQPSITKAIGNGDISLAPADPPDPSDSRTQSWFIYNFEPGAKYNGKVAVRNESEEVKTLWLYAVDGYTTTQGGFALRNSGDPREYIGKWLVLEKSGLTLKPYEEEVVRFQYTVPPNTEPGEYAGGVVAEDTEPVKGQGIDVVRRVGVRVYHTVPGERRERIELINSAMKTENGLRWFEATIKNSGNVSVNATLTENIMAAQKVVASLSGEQQQILPNGIVLLKTSLWKDPFFGSFKTEGGVYIDDGKRLFAQLPAYSFMTINPWLIALIILATILILTGIFWLSRHKKKNRKKK